ncbi:hypothetical protein ACFW9F_03480 [Streptomyces sp. NPDC059506]|uniref:hypothetical protein n=1 Tax=Streptomyces TaxID=1883 RepID=UPI0036B41753
MGLRPDGARGEKLAPIQQAGPRAAAGTVVEVGGTEFTGARKDKQGGYWFADLRVDLSDRTVLAVDRGIVDHLPYDGMEAQALHVPSRPELGGWAAGRLGGSDLSSYLSSWYALLAGRALMSFSSW